MLGGFSVLLDEANQASYTNLIEWSKVRDKCLIAKWTGEYSLPEGACRPTLPSYVLVQELEEAVGGWTSERPNGDNATATQLKPVSKIR